MKNTNKFFPILFLIIISTWSCKKEYRIDPGNTGDQFKFANKKDSFNVSVDEASKIAVTFAKQSTLLKSNTNLRTKLGQVEVANITTIPDRQNEPALYIINYEGEGFLILSATKKESPILGFSDQGGFNAKNVPLGMNEWLRERSENIQTLKNDRSHSHFKKYHEWDGIQNENKISNNNARTSAMPPVVEQYGPLLSTHWGQGVPYNNYVTKKCPSGNAPTGCVATAIAQVARYHAYPGENSWGWSLMPLDKVTGRSVYGDNNVAVLLQSIGIWVKMDYGCDGSGANTGDAVGVFRDRFKYNRPGSYQTLSVRDAAPKIQLDIKNNRPVIMAGNAEKGNSGFPFYQTEYKVGHAWVCDGFLICRQQLSPSGALLSNYYHMNWGWDGASMGGSDNNGWFKLDDLQINGSYNFQYNRRYITGISPY